MVTFKAKTEGGKKNQVKSRISAFQAEGTGRIRSLKQRRAPRSMSDWEVSERMGEESQIKALRRWKL